MPKKLIKNIKIIGFGTVSPNEYSTKKHFKALCDSVGGEDNANTLLKGTDSVQKPKKGGD